MALAIAAITRFVVSSTLLLGVAEGFDLGFNPLGDLIKELKMEAAAIAHPIETSIMKTLSSQCAIVKNMFGFHYDQMKGADEPDMRGLKLEFSDSVQRVLFNILTASVDIPKSPIYRRNETVTIFVHGFTDDPTKQGYFNILALDGSSLIKWLYLRSTTYARFMGKKLGEVLAAMVKDGLDPKKIHMIGHSLGAHIAGFTGKSFYKKTGRRIGRISGLDPAAPCFVNVDKKLRLQKSDADFVDVIHTDSGVFGLTEPLGHVDVFPNGGSKQPGCIIPGCDHSRAWHYYAESIIHPNLFPAAKCQDWEAFKNGNCEQKTSYMGHACLPTQRGSFYLQTGDSAPYGLGPNGTKFNNNEAIVDIVYSVARRFF